MNMGEEITLKQVSLHFMTEAEAVLRGVFLNVAVSAPLSFWIMTTPLHFNRSLLKTQNDRNIAVHSGKIYSLPKPIKFLIKL